MKSAATLFAICIAALLLRVVPQYHHVFRGDHVVFAQNDPWIHMRNADNIAAHWPLPTWWDPYRVAPGGEWTEAPLMDVLIAGIALVTRIPLDVVGAWFPAVCGALIPIPLFFLARTLFGDVEAVVAAALVAILPGSLLQRSLIGVTDHHVLEALLAACVLLFLVRGQPVVSGIFLGLYLLTWARGAFLLLILVAWALLTRHGKLVATTFGVALLIAAPVAMNLPTMRLTMPLLAVGGMAIWIADRLPRRALPLAALALVVAAVVALPDLVTQARRFLPTDASATIGEVQRLPIGDVWFELTTASILAPMGFVIAVRERTPQRLLLLVFAAVVTTATFAQARFAYYMAIAAAVLAAVASARLLWRGMNPLFGALAIAAIAIYPNATLAMRVAARLQPGPTDGWMAAMEWMRAHTPEPFESPDRYFARHGSERDAPPAGYGVMVWSDYGWWVTRIARRPPSTNPTHIAVREAAQFYLATDEAVAVKILAARKARYAIADRSIPMTVEGAGQILSSQLEVMARWAGENPSRYYELAWEGGQPLFLYYPDYYRTMAVRLFGYDGKGFTPANTSWAIAMDGRNRVTEKRRFPTHEEAAEFVASDPRRWRLAGLHPIASCVPLEPLTRMPPVWIAPAHDVKIFELR